MRIRLGFGVLLWLLMSLISGAALAETKPLPANEAFHLVAKVKDANHVDLQWDIAANYHLYSDAIAIDVVAPSDAKLADWQLPDGKLGSDPVRGHYLEYYRQLIVPLTLQQGSTDHLRLKVSFQGCADLGFCYPPQTQIVEVGNKMSSSWFSDSSDVSRIEAILAEQSLVGVWLSFFVFGLLLAFTPCIFPMLPILSSIIVGHGLALSRWRAFYLSSLYVTASALTYALAGVLAGLAGSRLQSALQSAWVLASFGLVLFILSLSLFGFYELQLPAKWQQKLDNYSRKQVRGSALGAFIMGAVSTLVVSPCVSAPLVGALAYISESGSPWLGGSALLIMGFGMGLPLILFGVSAGHWLPKAGKWMVQVKAVFGISLVWLAISLWSRFLPMPLVLALWGLLAVVVAVYLGAFESAKVGWSRFWKGVGLVLALYGVCLILGATSGATDPWQPLNRLMPIQQADAAARAPASIWQSVWTLVDLDARMRESQEKSQPLLIDFYADWCVSCRVMDQEVFGQADVQQWLRDKNVLLLRVDVTQQSADQKTLEKRFDVIAPPTLIYIDGQGKQRTLVGEQTAAGLLEKLQA